MVLFPGWKMCSLSNFSRNRAVYARTVCKVTWPAKVSEKMDLVPGAQAPWRSVRAGLFGPALAWRRWRYHSVSLSALPSKGLTARPEVLMRGRMTHLVLLRGGWGRRSGGDGDFDQFDRVVCLGGFAGFAATDAKESVVCLAPGLREFATATLYCLMTSGLLALRGIMTWKANSA